MEQLRQCYFPTAVDHWDPANCSKCDRRNCSKDWMMLSQMLHGSLGSLNDSNNTFLCAYLPSGLWTGWHQLQSQSLAELGRRGLTINLCSCDRNSVQSVIICYHSPHHGVEHHVLTPGYSFFTKNCHPQISWCTLPAFGDENSLHYFKGQVSSKGMSMPSRQVQIQNGCGRVGQISLFNCPKASWYISYISNSFHMQVLLQKCVKKNEETKSKKFWQPSTNRSKVPASYGIFHSCNASNAELPRLSVWYEKTVISPVDVVILLSLHVTIIRPALQGLPEFPFRGTCPFRITWMQWNTTWRFALLAQGWKLKVSMQPWHGLLWHWLWMAPSLVARKRHACNTNSYVYSYHIQRFL